MAKMHKKGKMIQGKNNCGRKQMKQSNN